MRSIPMAHSIHRRWSAWTWAFAAVLAWGASASPAHASDDQSAEGPPPKSVQESLAPIDRLYRDPIPKESVVPTMKATLERKPAFLRDAKASLNVRSFYLLRDKFDPEYQEAWALGGSLLLKSGYICDRVALGLGAYASVPLYAPEDRDGTLLLQEGQEWYAVLGQLFADVKIVRGVEASLFRKEYNTPYINRNDNRMTPNSFEAYTVRGVHGGKDGAPEVVWGGGFFTRIKERNDDEFVWMSQDAGVDDVKRGVAVAGGKYSTKRVSIGAIEYWCEDILNIFYAEGTWIVPLRGQLGMKLFGQFTDQRSTGSDLLTGAAFSTWQAGLKAEASYGAFLGTVGVTTTDGGSDMRNPWSSCPGYTSVQVQDFNRAGEEAVIAKASLDLCKAVGIPGVSVYALWVHGWDRVAGPDEDEVDFDVQWRPMRAKWKAFSLRVRYALVQQRGAADDELTDLRVILNYDVQLP